MPSQRTFTAGVAVVCAMLLAGCIAVPTDLKGGTFQRTQEMAEGISAGSKAVTKPESPIMKPVEQVSGAFVVMIGAVNMPLAVVCDVITYPWDKARQGGATQVPVSGGAGGAVTGGTPGAEAR